jgi:putative transcriptional regulator
MTSEGMAIASDQETAARPAARALDTLLAAFAAGGLSEAFAALVAAHLELHAGSRDFVAALEIAGGILLDGIEPVALNKRDRRLELILAAPAAASSPWRARNCDIAQGSGDDMIPAALRGYIGRQFQELDWVAVVPGLSCCTIASDRNGEARLMRCRAGKRIPYHRHDGLEAALVLQGGLGDTLGHYLRGDVAVADEELAHAPVADPNEECIYFIACEGTVRYSEPAGFSAPPLAGD